MRIYSNDFVQGAAIPDKCAYRKGNTNPHLAWDQVPAGTKSFALICNDPDAPVGNWIHWLVHGIPPTTKSIPSGGPVPGVQEENDFGEKKWGGPAPPSGTHRYLFTMYALNVSTLKGVTKKNFREMCEARKIESAQTMGTCTRK